MPALTQFAHGSCLLHRTLRRRHVTQLRGLRCGACCVAVVAVVADVSATAEVDADADADAGVGSAVPWRAVVSSADNDGAAPRSPRPPPSDRCRIEGGEGVGVESPAWDKIDGLDSSMVSQSAHFTIQL